MANFSLSFFARSGGIALAALAGCSPIIESADPIPAAVPSAPVAAVPLTHTLTVSKLGAGDGQVVASDYTINCGAVCIMQAAPGRHVTLEARTDTGSNFLGWSGACTGTGSCTLNVTGPLNVVANFQAVTVWRKWNTGTTPLLGLWASSPQDLWVSTATTLQRWNGTAWTLKDTRTRQGEGFGPGLFGQRGGSVFAELRFDSNYQICESSGSGSSCTNYASTNYSLARYPAQGARVEQAIGSLSGSYPSYTTEHTAVWSSSGTLYATVCNQLSQFNGSQWKKQDLPSCAQAVWGTSDADYWLVGKGGAILRGGTLAVVPSGTTQDLYGVWGSDPAHYFAVGKGGVILRWNGTQWSAEYTASRTLRAVWGAAADDVWAVGDLGLLVHYDGQSWTEVASGTTQNLHSVFGTSPTQIWALGADGTILTTLP